MKLLGLLVALALFASYVAAQDNSEIIDEADPDLVISDKSEKSPEFHSSHSPMIRTHKGRILGRRVDVQPKFEAYEFLAIPYAEPPTGHRRFRRPQPKKHWRYIFRADRPPRACPQNFYFNREDIVFDNLTRIQTSEDCLTLSIWVPKKHLDHYHKDPKEDQQMSVLAFFHRGGYGGGYVTPFDGSHLAAINDVIVVAIQYRIGTLGFAFYEKVHSNNGLWDQVKALKWIHENIHHFGGNKHEVTIAGAGPSAVEVGLHLVSHHSRKYYHRAILQSVTAFRSYDIYTPDEAAKVTDAIFNAVTARACPLVANHYNERMKCLRHAPSKYFVTAEKYSDITGHKLAHISPVYDDHFLHKEAFSSLRLGHFARVPILIGMTKDDGANVAGMPGDCQDLLPSHYGSMDNVLDYLSYTDFDIMVDALPKWWWSGTPRTDAAQEAVKLRYFPTSPDGVYPDGLSIAKAMANIVTESSVLCPTLRWAEYFSHHLHHTYAYWFSHRRPGSLAPEWMGVPHGSEMPYVFGEPLTLNSEALNHTSYEDVLLSRAMMAYWANFIKHGNPNGRHEYDKLVPHSGSKRELAWWPEFRSKDCLETTFEINVATVVDKERDGAICRLKETDCNFWERFLPQRTLTL